MLKKRTRGIISAILGGIGTANWVAQGMPIYSGSYGVGQKMGIIIFLTLLIHGIYVIATTPKEEKNKPPDQPNK